jgi:hypothetical protein
LLTNPFDGAGVTATPTESAEAIERASEFWLRLKARIAGFLYLLVILGALFTPFAVAPSGMMRGVAAIPTATRILASEPTYVLGGAVQLFLGACDIGIALIFYELLRPVSRSLALLAAFFRVAFVAMTSANVINHFAALILLTGGGPLTAFRPDQLQALATFFLRLRTIGFDIALTFFGVHCVLVGYLLFRSTFFPRILGLLLAIGGVGYMLDLSASFLPAAVAGRLFPYVMLPAGLAELLLTLWLIIVGVNVRKWKAFANEMRNPALT